MISALIKIDAARKALALASSVQEVLGIRDKAEAVRNYYRQRDGSLEAMNLAAELKLRAERKLGELLRETVNHAGSRGQLKGCTVQPQARTLPDGVSKTDSHRWQRIAAIPEERFEQHLAEAKAKGEVTTAGALQLAIVLEREKRNRCRRSALEAAGGNGIPDLNDCSWRIVEGDCLDELLKVGTERVRLAFAAPPLQSGDRLWRWPGGGST